jgi:hypothetical protein
MAFDLALLKEHPYATGGVVIVGGLVVFYLLSSSSAPAASSAPASSPGGLTSADYQASLAAASQNAQVQAASQAQQQAQQVALQQQQLEAQVANNQTAAAIHTSDTQTAAQLAATLAQIAAGVQTNTTNVQAQTADTANQYVYAENLQAMQDQVLESQINSGVIENANNNATALAGLQSTNDLTALQSELTASTSTTIAGYQATAAEQGIKAATDLSSQQLALQYGIESNVENYVQTTGLANTPNKDNLNAATALLQQILAGGNPTVAIANQQSTASQAASSAAETSSIIASITGAVSNVAAGLLGRPPALPKAA